MEIPFEYLVAGLEATRGTAVEPTRYLNLAGVITPANDKWRPDESTGTLAEFTRSKTVRKWGNWAGKGPADPYTLPFLFNMAIKGLSSPSTPSGATNARLWEFAPTMTSDDLKTATLYGGDPNVQVFRGKYGTVDDFSIKGDASGTNGVEVDFKGQCHYPTKTAPGSLPAQLKGPLLAPGDLQLWIDTASDIGTTEIVSRVVSAEFSHSTKIGYKWLGSGPNNGLNFTKIGRGKRHAESKIIFEVPDMTQWDQFGTDDVMKVRLRFNGSLIESGFYHFLEWDIYGAWDGFDWGENQGTNRTIELTVLSEYNTTAGHDFALRVQNDRTTL